MFTIPFMTKFCGNLHSQAVVPTLNIQFTIHLTPPKEENTEDRVTIVDGLLEFLKGHDVSDIEYTDSSISGSVGVHTFGWLIRNLKDTLHAPREYRDVIAHVERGATSVVA